jgi:superfamily I DNA and/or RNA helicase
MLISLRDCCELFDVVLVDESSQAVEIEVLVPISLCKPFGLVVLAGI